jgi:restriction system protein
MARRRRNAGEAGVSATVALLLLVYYVFDKLKEYHLLASLILGLVFSLVVALVFLILRALRIRKANLLAKESLYRDYSPVEFEHLTAEIFRQMGYKADTTPPSGDKGLDVILSTREGKIGVQCKRYQDAIGPAFIREFAGALEGAKISQGIFVTTSEYTEAAKQAARNSQSKITLLNGEKLGELRNKAEKRINTDLIPTHWWGLMPSWQKGVLIALFFLCVTAVVSVTVYIVITMSSV